MLDGTKTWITNGGIANVHVIVASVDPKLGSRGQASFIVPEGTPGLSMGQKFKKMGIRASHTAEVVLEDCRVPGACLLGGKERLDEKLARVREGKRAANQAAMATFEATRPAVGAQALGIARAAYEYSLAYAKERKQFGRAIIENQAIAFKLANMKMSIDAARLLVWRASWMAATRKPFTSGEGSMSKLMAGETAVHVTEEAIQILGGLRLRPGLPRRALAPGLEDLHDLRGHQRDPAPDHRPLDLRCPDPLGTGERVSMTSLRLVTLCSGNVARSVMLGSMLTSLSDANGYGWSVRTAGTHVVEGLAVSARTRNALHSLDDLGEPHVGAHRSHQLNGDDVTWADAILTSEASQVTFVRAHFAQRRREDRLAGRSSFAKRRSTSPSVISCATSPRWSR